LLKDGFSTPKVSALPRLDCAQKRIQKFGSLDPAPLPDRAGRKVRALPRPRLRRRHPLHHCHEASQRDSGAARASVATTMTTTVDGAVDLN